MASDRSRDRVESCSLPDHNFEETDTSNEDRHNSSYLMTLNEHAELRIRI